MEFFFFYFLCFRCTTHSVHAIEEKRLQTAGAQWYPILSESSSCRQAILEVQPILQRLQMSDGCDN